MDVLITCPTIDGREDTLQRMIDSYERTLEGHSFEIITVLNEPTWGRGVNVCMQLAFEKKFDYVHMTSDDIEAHDGWFEVAKETLYADKYPAPMLLNPDGSLAGFGHGDAGMYDVSRDWKPTLTSVMPTMTFAMWKRMGPMIELFYYTDDFMSHRARQIGYETVARYGYTFTHHESQVLGEGHIGSRQARLQADMVEYNKFLRTGVMP